MTLADGRKLPLPRAQLGPAVLCVRPELVQLDAPAAPGFPAIEARVTDARFQGSIVRILLETALGPMIATRQITSAAAVPEVGSAVRVSWAPPLTHVMEG